MSVFWLAPQFLIIGIGDGFTLVGLQEYFYDQVPNSMRSLRIALYLSVIVAANFISSLLITIVDHITENSGKSWFGKDLNSSGLDYFYWLLAAITAVNLCVYVFVAGNYTYKNVHGEFLSTILFVQKNIHQKSSYMSISVQENQQNEREREGRWTEKKHMRETKKWRIGDWNGSWMGITRIDGKDT
ncbi:protein nrt1 ptr family 5.7 [Nicotiana attenuata]|uniref:Protein nrt1 ptr family 5.7 n=1 Tax=Nicotiana attenuata TaxID=49451 RepID=A0A1J6K975_NICAT|nr:protein nrt1 ptr family 5.7 [Nicotiana attenuata]